MSDWGWVAFAYTIVYGVLIAYVASLVARVRRVRSEAARR
jgi:hypothetical protein